MRSELASLAWLAVTLGGYYLLKPLYRKRPRWWTSPLFTVPVLLIALGLLFGMNYPVYIRDTHWLVLMLGPATVAFALPIWRYRRLIRQHWAALLAGVLGGSTVAMSSAWGLATLFGLSGSLRLSLVPRSITTPLAMLVSADIGGVPDLTALFVVITGVAGIALGELLLKYLPLRSALARGALFGVGAHGAGTAKAWDVGAEEGTIASLAMVLAGLLNVLAAPGVAWLLR
ncbi:LrgB family protein [Rhodanobacter glycinis]|jgi:predicted murein hydrolase (TIGR00659 family)|uniref:TIGR00659 family protein n=1 Tax=Rhodanobacter glycinis TaxID=582702 RepID=A0A1I4EE62_9GAMM|nr:LrgB family protein [Rhodanobacter glycinis]TAM20750.1 MAG: LrgB family protein [Rhodanobacter sp.]SFL04064.1 TIGR00659 family protein [Rhodanobacter glycinis]